MLLASAQSYIPLVSRDFGLVVEFQSTAMFSNPLIMVDCQSLIDQYHSYLYKNLYTNMTKFPEALQITEMVNREKGATPLDDHFKLSTGQKRKRRAALKATKKNDKRAKNNKRKG